MNATSEAWVPGWTSQGPQKLLRGFNGNLILGLVECPKEERIAIHRYEGHAEAGF